MAFKGTAGKSVSGASMSKYDVEVEARLQALEAKPNTPLKAGGAALDKLNQFEKKVNLWQESLDAKFDIADAKVKNWEGFDEDAFARLDKIEEKLDVIVEAIKKNNNTWSYVDDRKKHIFD